MKINRKNQFLKQLAGLFKPALHLYMVLLVLMFHLNAHCQTAKTKPIDNSQRNVLFAKAAGLNNGVSISWLEQTWNTSALYHKPFGDADFVLLKKLGFKSIRLPVAFEDYNRKNISTARILRYINAVFKQCKRYGFKLVIDYHDGEINDNNYADATKKAITNWLQISRHYKKESPDYLFFEIYNEPPHMDPQKWKDAAYNIVTAIRTVDKQRILLVGASNFNSIYELSRFVRLSDEHIIYTFHFYEPFFFTHQGAAWGGDQVSTTGVRFPYDGKNFPQLNPKAKGTWGETNYYQYQRDGNEQSVKDKLQIVKNWSIKYDVPILCSEYGVYNKYADADSRARYIKAVRKTLATLHIPGMLWDYNTNFSIFAGKPSPEHLSPDFKDALGY
ncbi:glycoside hydrolase family 5 protein [Mucilaginibacter jinjuensis]|uniref:Cellulase family glycosylhydrolase n=1 Tax=Mucilaginibacter jinjuensis TaxID=1176721 RepID=A0ABY7T736_9SPHI|nr:cellulase family glycosylhydrolase [Mucilaginibacter jinjuensis]WCT11646.1 cellulase family glycosylhydrolase [Mucilaginibacter jinjuensis]